MIEKKKKILGKLDIIDRRIILDPSNQGSVQSHLTSGDKSVSLRKSLDRLSSKICSLASSISSRARKPTGNSQKRVIKIKKNKLKSKKSQYHQGAAPHDSKKLKRKSQKKGHLRVEQYNTNSEVRNDTPEFMKTEDLQKISQIKTKGSKMRKEMRRNSSLSQQRIKSKSKKSKKKKKEKRLSKTGRLPSISRYQTAEDKNSANSLKKKNKKSRVSQPKLNTETQMVSAFD